MQIDCSAGGVYVIAPTRIMRICPRGYTCEQSHDENRDLPVSVALR
jgi:hypothetical protein